MLNFFTIFPVEISNIQIEKVPFSIFFFKSHLRLLWRRHDFLHVTGGRVLELWKKVKFFFEYHALRIRSILGRSQWLIQIGFLMLGSTRLTKKVQSVRESTFILLVYFHRKLCNNIWINCEFLWWPNTLHNLNIIDISWGWL